MRHRGTGSAIARFAVLCMLGGAVPGTQIGSLATAALPFRRNRSIAGCENWPGNAWATTITSGESGPAANAAAAESTAANSVTSP